MMNSLRPTLQRLDHTSLGAASVEYSIVASLIAAVIVATVATIGSKVGFSFCTFLINFAGSC